jgi:hypothetical protein
MVRSLLHRQFSHAHTLIVIPGGSSPTDPITVPDSTDATSEPLPKEAAILNRRILFLQGELSNTGFQIDFLTRQRAECTQMLIAAREALAKVPAESLFN